MRRARQKHRVREGSGAAGGKRSPTPLCTRGLDRDGSAKLGLILRAVPSPLPRIAAWCGRALPRELDTRFTLSGCNSSAGDF
jgi:hypothetical protein